MFDATLIATDLHSRVLHHAQQLERALHWPDPAGPPDRPPSPLHADAALLVQIANGALDRASCDDEQIGAIIERVQLLLDLLFLPASGRASYRVPASFWTEPGIGQVLARVQAWLRRDDLIGLTEAAQLLYPELASANVQAARMRLRRLVERGRLMSYIAPDEPNPTQQARVSRQAIAALLASGQAD